MNRPYVKQFDAEGDLINPINGYFPSKRTNKAFPSGFPNRRERREALVHKNRSFSNKKGIQLVVTQIGREIFMKHVKKFQLVGKGNGKNKTITHYNHVKQK